VWSDQFDWNIQVIGDPARGELIDTIENQPATAGTAEARTRFAGIYAAADGSITGAVIVSWPRATFTLRRALLSKAPARDAAASLQELNVG
jgi:hypothetical protein